MASNYPEEGADDGSRSTGGKSQNIPRELKTDNEVTDLKALEFIKVLMYGFLFIMVLGTAVMSKVSFIVLATNTGLSRLHTDVDKALAAFDENTVPPEDGEDPPEKPTVDDLEKRYMEIRYSAVTFLLLALIIPEIIVFLSHFKSFFGSQPWPTKNILFTSLIVGTLETFGHCLLVFKVLPSIDIVRGVMLLSCVGFLPGVTRLIFGKESKTAIWQMPRKIMLIIAVVLQLTGPVAVLVFSYGWKFATPTKMHTKYTNNEELNFFSREPAKLTIDSVIQVLMNWEVILALFLTNLSGCENFLERNVSICGKNIDVCKLKSRLHTFRQKTYAILPLWKIVFMFIFVYALVPGYDRRYSFNLDFQHRTDPKRDAERAFVSRVRKEGFILVSNISESVVRDVVGLGRSGHRNLTEAIQREMKNIYVDHDEEGIERHPIHFLSFVSDPKNNMEQALYQMIKNIIETGDTYKSFALETIDRLLNIEQFGGETKQLLYSFKKFIRTSKEPGPQTSEVMKQGLEEYWPFILLILSSLSCACFARLSCKLYMKFAGPAVPLMLAGPVTVVILFSQCVSGFLPGYSHWICMEENGARSIFWITVALGFLWWISQVLIVSHIWMTRKGRSARTRQLFVVPSFSLTMIEQSLLYNRRYVTHTNCTESGSEIISEVSDAIEPRQRNDLGTRIVDENLEADEHTNNMVEIHQNYHQNEQDVVVTETGEDIEMDNMINDDFVGDNESTTL